MLKFLFALILMSAPANALTVSYPESGGKWVRVSDEGGKIYISDSQGFGVKLADKFGTVKDGVRTIRAHGGGYVYKALFMVDRQGNQPVRLLCDGFDFASMLSGCTSAATIWLGAKNVCIGRNAVFNFHGSSLDIFGVKPDLDADANIAKVYPPKISAMFMASWRNKRGMASTRVTASEIMALEPGMRYCK